MVLHSKAQQHPTVINNMLIILIISQGAILVKGRVLGKLHMDRANQKKTEVVKATIYT